MSALTRKLLLEARAGVPDGAGGQAENWTVIGEHWATLTPRGARENFGAGRQSSRVSHRALIRYVAPENPGRPKADQRFREGVRVYAILGVAEIDSRRERLLCWLEEGTLS